MSKAVYYKTYSSVPTDLPEEIYSYKLRSMFEFVKENLGTVDMYFNYSTDPGLTRTIVYNFPNDTEYNTLLSDPRHPANSLAAFVNDSVTATFVTRRNITLTFEVVDNWAIDETLTKATVDDFQFLDSPAMSEDEIQIYNAQVLEIENYMEQTNNWGRHTDLFGNE